jgi:hypothetical protein
MQFQQEKEEVNIDAILTDYDWNVGGEAAALENRLVDELSALDTVYFKIYRSCIMYLLSFVFRPISMQLFKPVTNPHWLLR